MNALLDLVLIFMFLFFLNMVFIATYCRIEKRIDKYIINNRMAEKNESVYVSKTYIKKNKLIQCIKELYKQLDHYFYGWMRLWQIKIGRFPSNRIRRFFYKYIFCMNITSKTVISSGCEIRSPWNVHMGNCIVAGNCIIDGRSGVIIRDNAVLGMNVHIWTQEHDVNSPSFAVTNEHRGCVVVGERVWVCSDSTILPAVNIGEGAVVAAKALISKDCEPYTIYGGVPAKKIANRSRDLTYVLSGKPHWHFN